MRFYNANGYEFMTLKSDDASKRFEPLFDGRPVGTRRSEDGDRTREEPAEYGPATRGRSESEADWLL